MAVLTPSVTYALDDWYRLQTFNFAASFVEFSPPPPIYPDTIVSSVVLQAIGTSTGIAQTRYVYDRRGRHRHRHDAFPMPFVGVIPPGVPLSFGTAIVGPSSVSIPIGGGVAGEAYDLKCKVVLNTGAKLEMPGIYSVIVPATNGVIPVPQSDHLIDPGDPTTFTRDYGFDFGATFPSEFSGSPPPTIHPVSLPTPAGVVLVSGPTTYGSIPVAFTRIYCTVPGLYTMRCLAFLSNGYRLSIPWTLNAYLAAW